MRGASRATLAEARDRLAAALAAGAEAGPLGDDLFSVAGLLDREPGVRSMLSDPARETRAKTGLVEALLAERISAPALEQVTGLVSGRWSASRDLADAAEELGVLAIAAEAQNAEALDELEDELFRFGRVVEAEPDLRAALSNPFIPAEPRQQLLDALLEGKVTQPSLRLITQAAFHPRGRSLEANLAQYARLAAELRERLVAEVHVATELSEDQRGRLAAALAAAYGHEVQLNVVIDPQVVGGMSVRIGDELIDGSMASRLAELRRRLAA